jgi:hypothetical protein
LRLFAALAGDKANAPPLRLAIGQMDGTCRVFAGNFKAPDLITEVQGERKGGLRRKILIAYLERSRR